MEIKTKFNVGQEVWYIDNKNLIITPCQICDHTGSVVIKGVSFVCPKCHGNLTVIEMKHV
jgi:predicted RNA-binding Zn-ribbon protein involved in translation (DUF1610 family)